MTTTTPDSVGVAVPETHRPSGRVRFAVAFLIGLLLATVAGAGALYAYDQQYIGRVLPGVRVGAVDLSGLEPAVAAERLRDAYASLGEGEIIVKSPRGSTSISFADIGRGPDVDAMLAEALAVGREGNPVERVIADARTAIRGVTLTPRVTYDADALAERIVAYADSLALEPVDGSVQAVKTRFVVHAGVAGRLADAAAPVEAAFADVGELDAPASLTYALPVRAVEPEVTTAEASAAKATAERIAAEVTLSAKTGKQKITQSRLRSWITFAPTADGGYAPSMDTAGLPEVLKKLAKKINQAPINASFKTSGGRITGVTASKTGYKMDVEATQKQVLALIAARLEGGTGKSIEPTAKVTQPALTTAEAKAARPKMRKISQWTTPFPISDRNGFGANIWIPARLIDGYVVAPRATFDFWDAVGIRHSGQGLQVRRRDHQRPDRTAGRPCRRDLLLLDDALQRRPAGRLRDGRPAQSLLLHRPLSARPRRDRVHQCVRFQADGLVHERHGLPGAPPRVRVPRRRDGLREVRGL